jgi:hypothetical protein
LRENLKKLLEPSKTEKEDVIKGYVKEREVIKM